MALYKTSLQLDEKVTADAKKIAVEQDISFQKWLRNLVADAVSRDKKAKAAARRRSREKAVASSYNRTLEAAK